MQSGAPESTNVSDDRSLLRQFREGVVDAATELNLRYAKRLQVLTNRQTSTKFAGSVRSRRCRAVCVPNLFSTCLRGNVQRSGLGKNYGIYWRVLALNKIRTLGKHHCAQKRNVATTTSITDSNAPFSFEETSYRALRMAIEEMLSGMTEFKRTIIEMRIQGSPTPRYCRKTTGRSKRTIERIVQQFKNRLAQLIDDK